YSPATVDKVISLLKMLMNYALSKGYVEYSAVNTFPWSGSSSANPRPPTRAQIDHLETCELPYLLRHICDSWLVASELCLHYSDYMELPTLTFISHEGHPYMQHQRCKQADSTLTQTVNVTDRAQRILQKWGGPAGLYYKQSSQFSTALKQIADYADLRDSDGEIIGLQFGQGRDTGLTQRAIEGANEIQLSKMAGWSKPTYAEKYVGNSVEVVAGFVNSVSVTKPNAPQGYL
ncbi:hypothetical protein, partial [Spirosoma jeollabukense]